MPLAVLATIAPGGYVNPWKALAVVLVLLPWASFLAWVDKDAPEVHLPRETVNLAMIAGLILGYALFFLLGPFAIAFILLLLVFAGDVGGYLAWRSKVAGLDDLKKQFATWQKGMTKGSAKKAAAVAAGEVQISSKSGAVEPVPDDESPEYPRYQAVQALLLRPLKCEAEMIELVAGDPPISTFVVDGIRYDGAPTDRVRAAGAVHLLKFVAGLDMNEKRKPQTGTFKTVLDGRKSTIQITTAGSTTGESMRLIIDPQNRQNLKLESLGFLPDQLEVIQDFVRTDGGGALLATPKAQGLTTLNYGIIRAHDAFLYHVHTVERAPELDLEGITQNKIPSSAAGEESKLIDWVISQEPDVLMVTLLEEKKSAASMAKFFSDTKRGYVGIRAANTFDALKQWQKLVGDDALALKNLRLLVAGRLVRKLCSACKVGYTPDPGQLRKLNMNPEEVGKLYAARKEPMRDSKGHVVPCSFCQDLGFKGRIGVYEILKVDDEVRQVIKAGGSDTQLKQAFRKQRGRLIQEMALAQVKAGETSVEEVLRIFKSDSGSSASGSSRARSRPSSKPQAQDPEPEAELD